MIKEQGIVQKIKKDKAVVRVQQTSACANCKTRGSCNVSNREMLIEVKNDLRAKEGDLVELSVPEGTVLKLSLLIYFMPIIALMVGAFAGNMIAEYIRVDSTLASIAGGGLFMAIFFFALKRINRSADSTREYQPRMIRVL